MAQIDHKLNPNMVKYSFEAVQALLAPIPAILVYLFVDPNDLRLISPIEFSAVLVVTIPILVEPLLNTNPIL